jgi:mono/diheme cytochrome c family protein
MRRLAPFLGIALLLAGCGGGEVVSPTAQTVVGAVPTTTTTSANTAPGNAKNGAVLFHSQGCDGCHTFKPAGSTATVGPNLDNLAKYAQTANRGSLAEFVRESIADPGAYLEPGYQNIMPNFGQTLKPQQIADLVAYLTSGG